MTHSHKSIVLTDSFRERAVSIRVEARPCVSPRQSPHVSVVADPATVHVADVASADVSAVGGFGQPDDG